MNREAQFSFHFFFVFCGKKNYHFYLIYTVAILCAHNFGGASFSRNVLNLKSGFLQAEYTWAEVIYTSSFSLFSG